MSKRFYMSMNGSATGAVLHICDKIRAFTTSEIGGLFAVFVRTSKGRPVTQKVNPTPAEAFVAGFNFSLMTLDTPQLTPGQSEVLRKTLDEAMAKHQKTGLAGLLGRVAERVRDQRYDYDSKSFKGFVILVNENMDAERHPRLTEDQSESLRGMIAGLLDAATDS